MDDFTTWVDWVSCIDGVVTELCVGRDVYRETLEMHRRNPEIQKPNLFYSWMRGLFVTWCVILIGRLVDNGQRTRSFVRLLGSIQKHSQHVSREHHVGVYVRGMMNFSDEEATLIANRSFDRLVGNGEAFLPKTHVEADIQTLLHDTKPITDLRNERVAHIDPNPSRQLPTYESLDAANSVLVTMLYKYSELITGHRANPYPVIQYDWLEIFRVPWIKQS